MKAKTQIRLKKIPTVGFLRFLRHASSIVKNPLPFHHANFERVGPTFRLQIGLRASVIFSRDANLLRYVLQKNQRNYTKSKIQTKDLAKYVGKGLLTAEGEHWQRQRKLIQPAFHKKQLYDLLDTMQQAIATELAKIKTDKPQDIFPVFNDLAFQVVAKTLFSGGVSKEQITKLQGITEAAQKMLVKELRQPFKIWWFNISGLIQKHIAMVGEARSMINQLIEDRLKSLTSHGDLLDMLLAARYEDDSAMSREQLIDEILILFTAGHETTSNALTFATQLLATHPESLKKVRLEAETIKGESTDLLNLIKKSEYTQQVIQESMRLYPPAYFIDRVNYKEDRFGEYRIKKESTLLFSVHEIHRNPAYWEKPNKFIPERFDPKNPREHSDYYFPFGAGPRMCIGNNFAMYEMILAVVHLVSNYQIEFKQTPIEILPLITLKPKDAILVFRDLPNAH